MDVNEGVMHRKQHNQRGEIQFADSVDNLVIMKIHIVE